MLVCNQFAGNRGTELTGGADNQDHGEPPFGFGIESRLFSD